MYLNTSNVTVNHKIMMTFGIVKRNLNTSNVTVNLLLFLLPKSCQLHLNTSNVTVNLKHGEDESTLFVFKYI